MLLWLLFLMHGRNFALISFGPHLRITDVTPSAAEVVN